MIRSAACVCLVVAAMLSGGCNPPQAEKSRPDSQGTPVAQNQLTAEEVADGWIQLFDGETLFGWTQTSDANWEVRDGSITVSEGEPGFLQTNSQFGDFELIADFKSEAGTNSGIFLHAPTSPGNPAEDCYELNIADVGVSPFPTGSFVGRQVATGDEDQQRSRDKNEWQQFHVVADGGKFTVKLDGETVLDYTDPDFLGRGHILLQLNSGAVAFRNIKLRPLNLANLMSASSYADSWTDAERRDATFDFADAELHVSGGPGQLESKVSYGDFIAQTEVKVNGDGLNSGIFFRCIPGQFQQGYESQIHNGFENDDRTQPVDAGTGAIFRRQAARRVIPDDRLWFVKTIVCSGKHMAVWVNGYPVTDWTDEREPRENPRQGQRIEPGTFALQAHDPTTDLSFRNFRVVEISPRAVD